MVTPLDPFLEAFAEDPLTGLALVALVFLLSYGGEIIVARVIVAPWVAKRAIRGNLKAVEEGQWDPAMERATAPVRKEVAEVLELVKGEKLQAQIGAVETRLEELDKAMETRLEGLSIEVVEAKVDELDEAMGAHMASLNQALAELPMRVRSSVAGEKGAEMKKVYAAANEAEETIIEEYRANLTPEEKALAKLESLDVSPEYAKTHEVGASIIRGIRDWVVDEMQARRGDVVTLRKVGERVAKKFPQVYGGR